jgi:hypothetical protein
MVAQREGRSLVLPSGAPAAPQRHALLPGGSGSGVPGFEGGEAGRADINPEPVFFVWLEGLPATDFSFAAEYVEPCRRAFKDAFLPDRCAMLLHTTCNTAMGHPVRWHFHCAGAGTARAGCVAVEAGALLYLRVAFK